MNYSSIRTMDISNGEGIRVSLFVSGCKFNCKGCFNTEAQQYTNGKPFTQDVVSTMLKYIEKPYVSGLSLLGGDPLWQDIDGLYQLISISKKTHRLGKTVWLWSGFIWENIFPRHNGDDWDIKQTLRRELVQNCDVWVDGQFELSKLDLSLKWKGSSNQRVIDVKQSLFEEQIVLYEGVV